MQIRPRRNRKNSTIRSMIAEVHVKPSDLVYPLFLVDGPQHEIQSMPGMFRWDINGLYKEIESSIEVGIKSFALFPCVEDNLKNKTATMSYDKNFFYLKHISEIKKRFPETCIITDVAMDPYSTDGHDGIYKDGEILNDETLDVLAKMSLAQAHAGADIIAPSDMMDGRVGYIRNALDTAGFKNTSIMSYTAKYSSHFYGPFRDALSSAPNLGDKKTYQMDYKNKKEALIEAQEDIKEGADFLMVKPALSYLDIINELKHNFDLPIAAYNVSGEYAMVMAAEEKGWVNGSKVIDEILTSIKRAGADIIFTYHAKRFAQMSRG